MKPKLLVITLKRTPERLIDFYKTNEDALVNWEIEVINGIDGHEQKQIIHRSRWVSASAKNSWTEGAIGSALSHIKAWQRCIEQDQDVVVVEDDVVLADDLHTKLNNLKIIGKTANQTDLVLLGWNVDSLLHAEFVQGLSMISLFEPTYPDLKEVRRIINSKRKNNLCKLIRCFGLPAYWINPQIAEKLMKACKPLQTEMNQMTRGIPEHALLTLDGMLNNRYKNINAKVIMPPIALALNDPKTSLTRRRDIQDFKER